MQATPIQKKKNTTQNKWRNQSREQWVKGHYRKQPSIPITKSQISQSTDKIQSLTCRWEYHR